MHAPMVLGPSGGRTISELVGHYPVAVGVGEHGISLSLFFRRKGGEKMVSEESRYGLAFLGTLPHGLALWNVLSLLHKRSIGKD